ncbi:MutS-related protein [Sciscionella marina]|uniref:MutS-related protein n=1 Tax=Sciscionella marina TaxID=508770 RepID=UPI0012F63799|nr:DNA mismatch repair protein MutS [Sciscionella marina]
MRANPLQPAAEDSSTGCAFSILYPDAGAVPPLPDEDPAYFADLNLDQVVEELTAGYAEHRLAPFFRHPEQDPAVVGYRQAVLHELDTVPEPSDQVWNFVAAMRSVRGCLGRARDMHCRYQQQACFLRAAQRYCQGVRQFGAAVESMRVTSSGLRSLVDFLTRYRASKAFVSLEQRAGEVDQALAAIRYCVHIKGSRVRVSGYGDEPDYGAEIRRTFQKFAQEKAAERRTRRSDGLELNHVEMAVLELVAKLYPEPFALLERFNSEFADFVDETISSFDREVHFYLAYLEFIDPLRQAGLRFCFPVVSTSGKEVEAGQTFDIALAHKLTQANKTVVCNDLRLHDRERILVITGPNQGGKTTMARTFAQVHYLAALGLLVPGSEARVYLFDQLFTHFEHGENLGDLRGKLQDDLLRMRSILDTATDRSIVILNELFTSTSMADASEMGTEILLRMIELGCLCVCVTFIDELSRLGKATVSMVSVVDPEDPAIRTYQLVRRPADGHSYAEAIAEKYGLTYDRIKERVLR